MTWIQLYTSVDDDNSFHDTQNHYIVHQPLGPVLGFSLEGLRCVVHKDDGSAIDYPPLQEYQVKYPSLSVTHHADIIGKYDKTEKLQDGVYKTRGGNGRLLLYKESKRPSDPIARRHEIECFLLLAKSKHIIVFRGVVVSQNLYQTDPGRVSGLVIRGFLTDYALRGSISRTSRSQKSRWWLLFGVINVCTMQFQCNSACNFAILQFLLE